MRTQQISTIGQYITLDSTEVSRSASMHAVGNLGIPASTATVAAAQRHPTNPTVATTTLIPATIAEFSAAINVAKFELHPQMVPNTSQVLVDLPPNGAIIGVYFLHWSHRQSIR